MDLPRDDDDAKKALAKRITQEAYGGSQAADSSGDSTLPLTEIRFLDLDLSSLDSVRQAAAEFVAQEERLDVLLLNAGILHVAPGTTTDGYEVHFGINYLGHALLSRLLIPTLLHTAKQQPQTDVRIIITSSEGHLIAPKNGIDFAKLKTDCADMVSTSSLCSNLKSRSNHTLGLRKTIWTEQDRPYLLGERDLAEAPADHTGCSTSWEDLNRYGHVITEGEPPRPFDDADCTAGLRAFISRHQE